MSYSLLIFVFRFTKVFLDVKEKDKRRKKASPEQGRSLMNLHNNEAGRRVRFSSCNSNNRCYYTNNAKRYGEEIAYDLRIIAYNDSSLLLLHTMCRLLCTGRGPVKLLLRNTPHGNFQKDSSVVSVRYYYYYYYYVYVSNRFRAICFFSFLNFDTFHARFNKTPRPRNRFENIMLHVL